MVGHNARETQLWLVQIDNSRGRGVPVCREQAGFVGVTIAGSKRGRGRREEQAGELVRSW